MHLLDNPEHTNIGRALEVHMMALGVTKADMKRAASDMDATELKWIFGNHEPHIGQMRRFHWVLMIAFERLAERPSVCVPFREQWFTTRNDQALHNMAMAAGRRVAWWWGATRTDRGAGAFCYACESLVHTYDLGRGITHAGRLAVMQHRDVHMAKLLGVTETRHGRAIP